MSVRAELTAFRDAVSNQFAGITANLQNIAGDTTRLLAKIQELEAAVGNSGNLSTEEQALLASIVTDATALNEATNAQANVVPEPPPLPPTP